MTRLASLLLVLVATGCAGQVGGSSSSSGGGASPATEDECKMGATESCAQDNGNVGSRACEVGQDGYVWGACSPASCSGAQMACVTQDAQAGVAQCTNGQSASACGTAGVCTPGAVQSDGFEGCQEACTLGGGTWQWQEEPCDTTPPRSPPTG
jgi:hypothetical protein